MKEVNKYCTSYQVDMNRLEHLKYGLCNEYGPNINCSKKAEYDLNKLVKTNCRTKNKK